MGGQGGHAVTFISVIVPVRNEERCVRHTLEQLLAQNYPADRFEVLVADGRSTDATREAVRAAAAGSANVTLLDNPRRWSSAGRNAAVRAARGDVLVVIDGHCELDGANYLANLAAAFDQSGADCVGRPQPLDVADATPLQRAIAAARSSPLGHHPDSFIYSSADAFVKPQSVAVAYRRSVFDQVGLFDESFDACEDVEFNHRVDRAGLRCFFTPRVAVRYHPRATLAGLWRQMVRYGRGRVRLLRKHPETFGLGCLVPGAFFAGLVAGPAVALLSPWLAALYAGTVGLYGLVVTLGSLLLALKIRELRLLPWLPLVFIAIHLGAGAGILLEAVTGAGPVVRRQPEGQAA
jgi:succinoglycan biosynthesis protein ExoA